MAGENANWDEYNEYITRWREWDQWYLAHHPEVGQRDREGHLALLEQAAYPGQPTYAGQPAYAGQQPYMDQAAYAEQAAYVEQTAYARQPAYTVHPTGVAQTVGKHVSFSGGGPTLSTGTEAKNEEDTVSINGSHGSNDAHKPEAPTAEESTTTETTDDATTMRVSEISGVSVASEVSETKQQSKTMSEPSTIPTPQGPVLVCVFHSRAGAPEKYPNLEDGICNYVVYFPVLFQGDRITHLPEGNAKAHFASFRALCRSHDKTRCLIGFRRIETALSNVTTFAESSKLQLRLLKNHRICGYGIMDEHITSSALDFSYPVSAIRTLKEAHDRVLGGSGCGVLLDVRLYSSYVIEQSNKLLRLFVDLRSVDMIIMETHTTLPASPRECKTNPIGPWSRSSLFDKQHPNINDAIAAIESVRRDMGDGAAIFLSSSLAMVEYIVSTNILVTSFAYKCQAAKLIQYGESVCPSPQHVDNASISGILVVGNRLYTFETAYTLREKAKRTMQSFRSGTRQPYTPGWALFNTEYLGQSTACGTLARIDELKNALS